MEKLRVDEEELLTQFGMDSGLSTEDIEATRRNMLTETLVGSRHPFVRLEAGGARDAEVLAHITLNGVTRSQMVAVEIETEDHEMRVFGVFSLNQSDFGITPFSTLGGLMRVQDRVDISFDLRASRDSADLMESL